MPIARLWSPSTDGRTCQQSGGGRIMPARRPQAAAARRLECSAWRVHAAPAVTARTCPGQTGTVNPLGGRALAAAAHRMSSTRSRSISAVTVVGSCSVVAATSPQGDTIVVWPHACCGGGAESAVSSSARGTGADRGAPVRIPRPGCARGSRRPHRAGCPAPARAAAAPSAWAQWSC